MNKIILITLMSLVALPVWADDPEVSYPEVSNPDLDMSEVDHPEVGNPSLEEKEINHKEVD